jgi:MOSC domain-containing protein YiiM
MRIVSLNVARPREVPWKGMLVSTGIFKQPVERRLMLRRLNLDGDQQADLSVHGGPEKAVYAYPSEHYAFWQRELGRDLDWSMFGENLTLAGLLEDQVRIGDRYRIGSAEVMVTQPRVPCFKLALKFGRDDIIKRFLESGFSGFYLSVVEEGEVGAGDELEKIGEADGSLTIAEINRLYVHEKTNTELLERAVRLSALPVGWRTHFAKRLNAVKQTSARP